MADPIDHLSRILERKRREVQRRSRFAPLYAALASQAPAPSSPLPALKRPMGTPPNVIAEIKLRSPSAGQIRPRRVGSIPRIAASYERHGAAAISVLCDGPGFGGGPLDLVRVSRQVRVPVLFKEFVLDELQLDLARAAGASMVLLLVRALTDRQLAGLIEGAHRRGLWPVVEAADEGELRRAVVTDACILGVNARDLRSFTVDPAMACRLVEQIPGDRVAVFMSGVRSPGDFSRVAGTRADAALIGEGLMRAEEPGLALARLLQAS